MQLASMDLCHKTGGIRGRSGCESGLRVCFPRLFYDPECLQSLSSEKAVGAVSDSRKNGKT